MCKWYVTVFEFSTFPFQFVFPNANLAHFQQLYILKCNTHFTKCNL